MIVILLLILNILHGIVWKFNFIVGYSDLLEVLSIIGSELITKNFLTI